MLLVSWLVLLLVFLLELLLPQGWILSKRQSRLSLFSTSGSSTIEPEPTWDMIDMDLLKQIIADWSREMPKEYVLMPLVLAGPSGVGKNRLVRSLLKDYSRFFKRVVTHTTRDPRPGEVNATDYYFITKDHFISLNSTGYFLESSKVHANLYGVSYESWSAVQKEGKIAIFEIDVQGVLHLKAKAKALGIHPKYVFISPPNFEMLKERLLLRGTESAEQMKLRVANAYWEVEMAGNPGLFDKLLVNDNFSDAVNEIFRTTRKWYPSLPNAGALRMLQRKMRNIRRSSSSQNSSGLSLHDDAEEDLID